MQRLIESLWQERQFSAFLITHDVDEAVMLADRIILIEDGRVTLDQKVDLPRPRKRKDPKFLALAEDILERAMGDEAGLMCRLTWGRFANRPYKPCISPIAELNQD